MKSRWRAGLFMALTALAVAGGYVAKITSSPPHHAATNLGPPFNIDIYVTDKSTKVNVEVDVLPPTGANPNIGVALYVEADKPGVLIASSIQDDDSVGTGHELHLLPPENDRLYAAYLADSTNRKVRLQDSFTISPQFINVSRGTVTARLPSIAMDENGSQAFAEFAILHPGTAAARAFSTSGLKPGFPLNSGDPTDYDLPDPAHQKLFWEPAQITSKVVLDDSAPMLDDARIDVQSPVGVPEGAAYAWTGGFGLGPFITATKWGTIESRSNLEFISGLLLGLAAAAMLALFVEFPDTLNWKKRWRRRHGKASPGIDAVTTSRILAEHHEVIDKRRPDSRSG